MHSFTRRLLKRPALLTALTIALWSSHSGAETLEGMLERGPTHSVLWFSSPESGDLIGQMFGNTSVAGRVILNNCLPGLYCVADNASTSEPAAALTDQLSFSSQPSGWWLIEEASNAYMQASLPMSERSLKTRYGQLSITDEDQMLLLNGRPVLESAQAMLASATPVIAATAPGAAAPPITPPVPAEKINTSPSLLERVSTWWSRLTSGLRHKLFSLLGRPSPAPVESSAPAAQTETQAQTATTAAAAAPESVPAAGTAEPVQGNTKLELVAHMELAEQDIVLLQSTGGTACPALYRFATLTQNGIKVTSEFGSCSDIAAITFPSEEAGATSAPVLSMPGFKGPFEPQQDKERAARQLHQFSLLQGHIKELSTSN